MGELVDYIAKLHASLPVPRQPMYGLANAVRAAIVSMQYEKFTIPQLRERLHAVGIHVSRANADTILRRLEANGSLGSEKVGEDRFWFQRSPFPKTNLQKPS